MKYYENYLIEKGFFVTYVEAAKIEADIRVLIPHLHNLGTTEIAMVDPVDNWLLSRIKIQDLGCWLEPSTSGAKPKRNQYINMQMPTLRV